MITLYGYNGRSRAERVLWALRELDLPFEMIRLDFQLGENKSPEFLRLNPGGKIPVLVHGDKVLTESVAIIHYLDSLSAKAIIPAEPLQKYEYDQRMFFLLTELEPYLWIADQESFLAASYDWPEGTTVSCKTAVERSLGQVDGWLKEQDFVANNGFSAADILAYHLLSWAMLYVDALPENVVRFMGRMEARPQFPKEMKGAGSPGKTG